MADLHDIRTDYRGRRLDDDLGAVGPWEWFARWMAEAIDTSHPDPTAMTLSTIRPDGRPASRVVLLKEFSPEGLVFFTNYGSAKGTQLEANPVASATFWWPEQFRQIHAVGTVTRLSREASERYFHSRPRGSQIGAMVSRQSQPLGSRQQFDDEIARATEQLGDEEVPLPDHWGGFVIDVDEFEFWQGQPSRLHDRIRLTRTADGWSGTRLYP